VSYKPLSFGTGGNVTFGLTGSQITASAPGGGGGGGVALSASGGSISNGTAVFSNANGVTFGMAGSTVTASHNGLTSQSAQAFSASGGSSAFQTLNFGNANGLTFSNNAGTLQASYTVPSTAGLLSAGITAIGGGTNIVTNGEVSFVNSNGVTFGLNNAGPFAQMTASHNGLTNIKVSAGTASANLSAVTFSNSNGVSFGLNGSVVTGSHNGLTNIRVSAGTASNNLSAVTFSNSNGVSFGLNGSVVTGSHNGLTNIRVDVGTDSVAASRLVFGGVDNIQFGLSGSTITANYSQTKPNVGVSGDTSSAYVGDIVKFSTSNGVAWSVRAGGEVVAVPVASQYAIGNTTGGASSAQQTGLAMTFSGAGVASVGLGGGGVVIVSVPTGGGGITNINVSAGTLANNLSALTFANSNGVSFGLSGSQITASVNAGGAGATMSQWPAQPYPWATSSAYSGSSASTGGSTQSTVSIYLSPFALPTAVAFNQVRAMISAGATAAGTGSMTVQEMYGLYTRSASTLSLVTSFAWNAVVSQNSTSAQTLSWWAGGFNSSSVAGNTSRISGNVSASMTGLRAIDLAYTSASQSLAAGQYYIGHVHIDRSSSVAVRPMATAWRYSVSQFTAGFGFSNTTGPFYCDCNGIASTTTNGSLLNQFAMPSSISLGAITATGGTSRNQWPLLAFASVTA